MEPLPTFFAPAERDPIDQECPLRQKLAAEPLLQPLLDCFPGPTLILNERRQAVAVNEKLVNLLQIPASELLGLRIGEMLDCVRWREEAWGCGTTVFCRTCEALRAILNAPDVQECHIVRDVGGNLSPLDLRIEATPITFCDEPLTVVFIHVCFKPANKL